MAILARLEEESSSERRRSARRRLELITQGSTSSSADIAVVIHDLSVSGLLIETFAQFSVGERIELDLPQSDAPEALIVWNSGRFYGCKFVQPISTGAVSAALLLSPAGSSASDNAQLMAIAMAELRALGAQVEGITDKLDQAIDRRRQDEFPEAVREDARSADDASAAQPQSPGIWIALAAAIVAIAAAYASVTGDVLAAFGVATGLLVLGVAAWGLWVLDNVRD